MSFYNYCRNELKEHLKSVGFEGYRADQLYRMVFKNNQIHDKTIPMNVMKHFRENLSTQAIGSVLEEKVSNFDGTRKLLIQLDSPKYKVESKSNQSIL